MKLAGTLALALALLLPPVAYGQVEQAQSDNAVELSLASRCQNGEDAACTRQNAAQPDPEPTSSATTDSAPQQREPVPESATKPDTMQADAEAERATANATSSNTVTTTASESNKTALNIGLIIAVIVGGLVGLGIYFLPFIIALARSHRQTMAIFVVNLFFGWSVLGWVGALVWAFIKPSLPHQTIIYNRDGPTI